MQIWRLQEQDPGPEPESNGQPVQAENAEQQESRCLICSGWDFVSQHSVAFQRTKNYSPTPLTWAPLRLRFPESLGLKGTAAQQ